MFARSRFTTLTQNGGCSHELRARSQKINFSLPQPVWLHLATRSQFDLQMALKSSPNDLKMIGFFLFLYLFLFLFLSLFLFLFLVIFFFLIIRFLQLDLQMPPKSSNNDSQMISKMISKASPPNYPEQFIQNRITESPNLRIPEFPPLPSLFTFSLGCPPQCLSSKG